jgi:2,4-didehydro-3-deoxy-L-rhamnonate hydrolase
MPRMFVRARERWTPTSRSLVDFAALHQGIYAMKLIRIGEVGRERPGLLLEDGARLDASSFGEDYDEAFFANHGPSRLQDWLRKHGDSAPRVSNAVRLGPPICRPSKIVCIGLNFRDHAEESGMEIPKEPVIFFKATSSLVGPNDPLVIPKNATKVDWEVELAVVMGKKVTYVSRENAMDRVAGFALHNDYSERSFQLERGRQWVKGKSADSFAPLGPFLATKDEIADFNQLGLWLKVNGEFRQRSSTSKMICDVPGLVAYVSEFMTLLPGDVISTGTPPGVGLGMKPPQYLKAGDVVELGIDGLGESRQHVVDFVDANSH